MIFDLDKITDTNENVAKGTIVIDLFIPKQTNQISVVDDTLELDGHRSGIYISQKVESEEGLIDIFEEINEQIGAYGMIHYRHNYNDAVSAKSMLVNVIRSKVKQNVAKAHIDWYSYLKRELFHISVMIKNEKLTIAIVIVDGNKKTQIESIPIAPVNTAAVDKEIEILSSNKRFIFIEAGLQLGAFGETKAVKALKDVKIRKASAKMVVDLAKITETNKYKSKGTIVIDLNASKKDLFKRVFACGKN